MGYFINYSGVVTLRKYSDVYGDVVRLGVEGKNLEFGRHMRRPRQCEERLEGVIDMLLLYLHFGL